MGGFPPVLEDHIKHRSITQRPRSFRAHSERIFGTVHHGSEKIVTQEPFCSSLWNRERDRRPKGEKAPLLLKMSARGGSDPMALVFALFMGCTKHSGEVDDVLAE